MIIPLIMTGQETGVALTQRKNVCIRSFSDPHFPAFGLNTETYSVSLRIQSESRKICPEKPRIVTLFTQCKKQTLNLQKHE